MKPMPPKAELAALWEHYDTIPQMAAHYAVDTSQIVRWFKKAFKMSPEEFLIKGVKK